MVGTDDLQPIFAAAKEAGVNVVLPVTERDNQGARQGGAGGSSTGVAAGMRPGTGVSADQPEGPGAPPAHLVLTPCR